MPIKIKEVKTRILEENDRAGEGIRKELKERGVFLVNLMASPGAGKTTTLECLIERLKSDYRIGVMEADTDSVVDSERIAKTGVRVLQLHTGGSCHMDACMTLEGLKELGLYDLDIVFLENVGNLVCPAEFDVGAALRLMILSVPEGDDKPLKYPLMFQVSDCLLVNKTDALPVFDFDMDRLKERVFALHPGMEIYPVSALSGDGFDPVVQTLRKRIEEFKNESDRTS